uniref:C2 domain-containing protein n=1 Tax=Physcomitrium patens TaxID=3218 RepID=A0A7I4D373_PHYPA
MVTLVVTSVKVFPDSTRNPQLPVASYTVGTLHSRPLGTCLTAQIHGPKNLFHGRPYKLDNHFQSKCRIGVRALPGKRKWRLLASVADGSKGDTKSGQLLNRFLKRGNPEIVVSDDSQELANDASNSRQEPQKKMQEEVEIPDDGTEPSLKPLGLVKAAKATKDRLLEAALKQVEEVKGFATNTSWTNYFTSVDASPAPIALSMLLQSDMKKKESAEWLNMVVGKVWNLYRRSLETATIEAVQPVIDEIPEKPPFVERVILKQFFLGDEPVTLRTIERRTSRRANDLQYHVGLRYTGNSRMVFSLKLKFGFLPIEIPVAIRGLDLDGEVWVKLRLIPTEPWVGTATWAFVAPPKVTLALVPFRLFNLMAIPLLNIFLTNLLTRDLPLLFVRPNKQIVNYLKGKVAGPLPKDFKDSAVGLNGFAGELSVTLIEARKLNYFPIGKTDPYVVFLLGEQTFRSKKNSKTSLIGPPGAPVWNQDFRMLVVDPKTQKLRIRVRDSVDYLGLANITVGYSTISIDDLEDTVSVDKVITLKNGRWFFLGRNAGELSLRLTYKAYVAEEEEVDTTSPVKSTVLNEIGELISKEMEETEVSPAKRQLRDKIVTSVDAQKDDTGFRFTNPMLTIGTTRKPPGVTSGSGLPVDPSGSINEPLKSNSSTNEPEVAPILSNPALEEQEKREGKSWDLQFRQFREDSVGSRK